MAKELKADNGCTLLMAPCKSNRPSQAKKRFVTTLYVADFHDYFVSDAKSIGSR